MAEAIQIVTVGEVVQCFSGLVAEAPGSVLPEDPSWSLAAKLFSHNMRCTIPVRLFLRVFFNAEFVCRECNTSNVGVSKPNDPHRATRHSTPAVH